jgi:hypothetical protein
MSDCQSLESLHDLIADTFLEKLKDPEQRKLVTASELSVMVKFLKDNDIKAAPVPQAKTTQIASFLPFPEEPELAVAEG